MPWTREQGNDFRAIDRDFERAAKHPDFAAAYVDMYDDDEAAFRLGRLAGKEARLVIEWSSGTPVKLYPAVEHGDDDFTVLSLRPVAVSGPGYKAMLRAFRKVIQTATSGGVEREFVKRGGRVDAAGLRWSAKRLRKQAHDLVEQARDLEARARAEDAAKTKRRGAKLTARNPRSGWR